MTSAYCLHSKGQSESYFYDWRLAANQFVLAPTATVVVLSPVYAAVT
jgi:hypothetical protein